MKSVIRVKAFWCDFTTKRVRFICIDQNNHQLGRPPHLATQRVLVGCVDYTKSSARTFSTTSTAVWVFVFTLMAVRP